MVRKFYLCEQILYPGSHWKPGFRNCYANWQETAHCLLLTCEYCHLYQTSIYSVVCLHNLNTGNRGSRLCTPSHVSSAMVACMSGVRMGSSHSFLRTALSCCTLVAPSCTPQVSGRREACLPRYDTSLGAWSGRLQIS